MHSYFPVLRNHNIFCACKFNNCTVNEVPSTSFFSSTYSHYIPVHCSDSLFCGNFTHVIVDSMTNRPVEVLKGDLRSGHERILQSLQSN